MEYTVENLDKAVTLFYRTEAQQQVEAHQWLTEAQNSSQAWSFVWELLSPQRSFQVQFFAATTLHTKLMKYWNEVPEDHYEPLKKRILEAIIGYAMGPKIVLNRLCIALSAYIIHTIPTHWPKAFEELVSSFQPQHLPNVEPERVIWILLEILTVIPEEFQSTTMSVSQRNRVRVVLQEVSKDILKVVEMCLMPLPTQGFDILNLITYLNATRCASAWIQLGGLNIEECGSIIDLLIDLTCFVYWHKGDPECLSGEEIELTEVTVEALTAVIQHPHTTRFRNSVNKHAASILYKFEKILDAERSCNDLNKDVVANLYGLIITLADTHSKIFIENLNLNNTEEQKVSFDLFHCILKCTDLPGLYPVDESASTLTFGFWYTLQDDILGLDTAQCAQLLLLIKPYYRNLVCILLRKSLLPIDDSGWSLDDKEVFRCYRQDIADTFIYCYNVLNLEMLDILTVRLNESLAPSPTNSGAEPLKWNEIETCLHAFGAVAESIEMENLYLPKLMATIKSIPFNVLRVKVLTTALETVGSYSEWLSDHPEVLTSVFPLVVSALGNPEVATSSTMALKDITQSCQKFVVPYTDHILMSAQTALQSGALKLSECRRLMFSIGRVLSVAPVDKVMRYLNDILAPTFQDLQKLVNAEPSVSVTTFIMTKLKILAALFGSLHVETDEKADQPIFVLMRTTMPLYRLIAERYCRNVEVMTDLSSLLKYGVTNLKDECKPLVSDILEIVVQIYRECPQGHVLVVVETVVILFGREDAFRTINRQLVSEICNTTLQLCARCNSNNQLSDISDILEGFFTMMSQLTKKLPQLILCNEIDVVGVFQCAILCLTLPETQTIKAVSSFLVNFITQSREVSRSEIVHNHGQGLVLRILLNLGTTAPRLTIEMYSDIILTLNKKYCDSLTRWLNALLAQENFPSSKISAQQKEAFVKTVLREKANKRKLCDAVLEFTLICRGILKYDATVP
ncbi:importin-13 [Cylas formicarius]|uniref:importin-13 n=1 Tax=Cylas formicarius TaxID=197179 RepID=UPI0029584BFF|nr:importin-13 [Cylas formicarius]